ncbi:restriction endonuclease [Lysinibacillus capsici]|uniref:restriction endonuclease n=1 Tax=Lysinibacillus capsici TaxID=2115968 RepID=UPI0021530EC4|nr:restriction endonuclease [Lysinibacillus capsici]MCR6523058.1 restriction endonuclease [Lysinibacillus capsici]
MFIPVKDAYLELTPEEFERYSLDLLFEQTRNLESLVFEHDKVIEAYDGNYQIDGYIEFTFMGVKYKTLVECKHYKSAITREKVQILHTKIQSIGAQKGILITTSNFQSGAIEYAKIHGIALIQLTEADIHYEIRDRINVIMAQGRNPFNYGKPYSGVLISKRDVGITCSYLSRSNTSLEEFLKI